MAGSHPRIALALTIVCALVMLTPPVVLGQVVPDGFSDVPVTTVERPTALAIFDASGDLLITSQPGELFFLENGGVDATLALDLEPRTCSGNTERGLLGVAIHPTFGNGDDDWIYLFYTVRLDRPNTPCVNRVSRFRFDGAVADPATEEILLDNMRSTNGNHNGGDLQFGKDGHLYVSIGEAGVPNNAQRRNLLSGKILRITAEGEIPPGNPFTGSRSSRCHETGQTSAQRTCREIFALGLRNPFRIAHDPNAADTRFFINDVGQRTWEEINRGRAGANFGWPRREGRCKRDVASGESCGKPPKNLTNPIYAYRHTSNCQSITGGAIVPDDAGWPNVYRGKYLFADFVCGTIFQLDPRGDGFVRRPFVTNAGPVIHLTFGPDGALYYTTFKDGGQVRRVVSDTP